MSMTISVRLENFETVDTVSFTAASLNYYLVDFASDGGSYLHSLKSKLEHLLIEISKEQKVHHGLSFSRFDVKRWIEDFDVLLDYYKDVNKISHIPSNLKVRTFIVQLRTIIINEKREARFGDTSTGEISNSPERPHEIARNIKFKAKKAKK